MTDLTKLPWYGGNKIPDSYLAKFLPPKQNEDMPYELRLFLDQIGANDERQQKRSACE